MLKRLLLSLFLVLGTLSLTVQHAEAKRLGGGGSIGMQRSVPQRQATPPAYQRPATPAPAPTAQPSGWRKWAGPLAGIAAGIGLAALLSHFGMSGDFAGILLLLIVGFVAFALLRRVLRPMQQRQPASAGGPSWQQQGPAQFEGQQAWSGGSDTPQAGAIPADFDVAAFTHQAKVNFIRLQAANDAGNLDDIREFTTPEMFAEIKIDIESRHGAPQKTDVVSLNAEVLEVAEEAGRYIVSARFHGMLREDQNAAPQAFDEVWHLMKPRDGQRGWVLAGIQQLA